MNWSHKNPFLVIVGRLAPLLILSPALLPAQTFLNQSFENSSPGGTPAGWNFVSSTGSTFQNVVDRSTAVDGAQSLRIASVTSVTGQNVFGFVTLSAGPAVGKTFHLSGYIRTQDVNGTAFLWADCFDASSTVGLGGQNSATQTGTAGWQQFDLRFAVPAGAAILYFGVQLTGTGTAWFDNLSIDVNGTNPYYPDPTAAQIQWIKANAIPFTSLDPNADLTELEPLKKMIGNARIVGLGEGTHGTSEFFRMKARLVSFLAQEMGFTIFAIEANMPESYRINDYVLTGRGDPKELLRGTYFWTWNTQEVLDMIEWMRQYNASGKGQIQFLGFDMQTPNVAMDYVLRFVRQMDPGLLPSVNASYSLIEPLYPPSGSSTGSVAQYQAAQAAAQSVLDQLQANRSKYLQTMSATEVDWAIQNARIVVQAAQMGASGNSNSTRDAAMAANVEWIAAQAPLGSRIVLWAHDGHINKEPNWMGGLLAQYFGQDYLAFGQCFHSGTYRAYNGVNTALDSFPGSVEYFFHQSGTSQQILDLRLANADDPASSWLLGSLYFRSIGAGPLDGMAEFSPTSRLVQDFDALVFFDRTTASAELAYTPMDLAVLAPMVATNGTMGVPYVEAPAPGSGAPASLPAGTVDAPYRQTIMGGGGACPWGGCSTTPWPPYGNWTVTAGALPAGLTLSADGVLSGTPTEIGSFTFTVQVTEVASGQTAQGQLSLSIVPVPPGLRFVAVPPCRVVDTRASGGPLTGGSSRSFAIPQSNCAIPATAQAYSFNVTAVPHGTLPYLTLWPTGLDRPGISTLNSFEGEVVANAAIVPAGANGAVSVYAAGLSDVILDIDGYFDDSTGPLSYWFYPAAPCRVADTRESAGPFGGPEMTSRQSRDFAVPVSACGMPFYAGAYSLNVTVVPDPAADYLGYLTTWPAGQAQPNVSTLNSWTGKVVANAAIVPAGANGSISVYVTDPTNVILDTNGYFAAGGSPGALSFYAVTPCRVADTRNTEGPFGGPVMTASSSRSVTIPASGCGVPATAAAYSLNVTAVPEGPLYYLTVWPSGSSRPDVSTLNSFDAAVVANAAIVPAGANGAVSVYVTNQTHVLLDINGYFAP